MAGAASGVRRSEHAMPGAKQDAARGMARKYPLSKLRTDRMLYCKTWYRRLRFRFTPYANWQENKEGFVWDTIELPYRQQLTR